MSPVIAPSALTPEQFQVGNLGPPRFANPLLMGQRLGPEPFRYVEDAVRVRYDVTVTAPPLAGPVLSFEKAGIRRNIYFKPPDVHMALVTCGGLSPGLNDVIRAVVMELHFQYGVRRITGIPFGYQGLNPRYGWPLVDLDLDRVSDIHMEAGTILGSSRDLQPVDVMVDTLVREKIHVLICIGGDGTHCGAAALHEEIVRRGLKIGIVGIPKTIDNDIAFVYKTFGFDTAVAVANRVLQGAHVEAKSYPRGIGLVKLMGRDSGFIAAHATLASGDVNFLLIPEIPFALEGPNGFLAHLERRLDRRNHAVVVAVEGAGQELFGAASARETRRSENVKYHDIGLLLKERILDHFVARGRPANIKYMDPGYLIRSTPANTADSIFCQDLGRAAVHAAMAGKTNVMIGLWHNVFVHVPIPLAVSCRKRILPSSKLWLSVLEMTGQPALMV